jgi:RNA polymerase sigma-70 factor (ECF subfamily)
MIAPGLASGHDAALAAKERTEQRPTFAQLYESQFSFVWRSARRLGIPAQSMDDVVQEVFVVVHRTLAKFERRSSIKTWLFGVVLNVVRAHRRQIRAQHLHAAEAPATADPERLVDTAAGPHELATRAEAARLVDALLDTLDDDKREVFVLAELELMSAPDIARAIGIPLNTVYSRLRLARQEFAAAAARRRARDEWRTR